MKKLAEGKWMAILLVLLMFSCKHESNNNKDNSLEVKKTYFSNGSLAMSKTYRGDSIAHGKCLYYYRNGKVKSEINFVEGKAKGNAYDYYESGNLKYWFQIDDTIRRGISQTFFDMDGCDKTITKCKLKEFAYFNDNGQYAFHVNYNINGNIQEIDGRSITNVFVDRNSFARDTEQHFFYTLAEPPNTNSTFHFSIFNPAGQEIYSKEATPKMDTSMLEMKYTFPDNGKYVIKAFHALHFITGEVTKDSLILGANVKD